MGAGKKVRPLAVAVPHQGFFAIWRSVDYLKVTGLCNQMPISNYWNTRNFKRQVGIKQVSHGSHCSTRCLVCGGDYISTCPRWYVMIVRRQ